MGEFQPEVNPARHTLSRVYDEHAPSLFRFVLSVTRCESVTEDVIQELFCRLAARPHLLEGVSDMRPYLFRSAHRLVIDSEKKRARSLSREEAASHPSPFAETSDPDAKLFQKNVRDALDALPPEQRIVVYLKVWEELSFQQIANSLDISQNTAASRYRYGIAKLRGTLRPLYDEIR